MKIGDTIEYMGEPYLVWGYSLTHRYFILYKDGKILKMI